MVDAPKENGAPSASAVKFGAASILAKAREYVVGVVIVACAGGFVAGWYAFEGAVGSYTKRLVVQAVAEDLTKVNDSTLALPIKNIFAHDRDFDVGELNSGHFVLTPTSQSYLLPIYFPHGSTGTLVVLLTGTIIPKRSYVTLLSDDGKRSDIDRTESLFPLKDAFDSPRPEGTLTFPKELPRERLHHFDDLRTLTFQLEGSDVSSSSSPSIEVTYVTLVSPTIKLDRH
jgi:hypothetical protein